MNRAVFLDRDNTIIHNDGDLGDPEQVRLIQGAASAIASLRGLGYKIVVISNQGGVARGRFTEDDVDAVNQRIAETIQRTSGAIVDRFYYCPYHPEAKVRQYKREHPWRKPSPGMLEQAADDLRLDLGQCWTIGDQLRDVAAGRSAGTRTVLLRAPNGQRNPSDMEPGSIEPDFVAQSLVEAVRVVAQQRRPEREAGPLPKPTSPAVAKVTPPRGERDAAPMLTSGHAVEPGHGVEPMASVTEKQRAKKPPPAPPEPVQVTPPAPEPSPEPEPEPAPPIVVDDDAEPPGSTDYLPDADELEPASSEAAEDATLFTSDAEADAEADGASEPDPAVASSVAPPRPMQSDLASPIKPAKFEPGVPSPRQRADMATAAERSDADQPLVARDQGAQLEDLLRQILRQLKRRQADEGDFSMLKMGAAVVQMVAIGCIFFAMYTVLGATTEDRTAFVSSMIWMLGAVFTQLIVVTLLLVDFRR